jgi:hypothetical protein
VCGFSAGVLAVADTFRDRGALKVRYGWHADGYELADDAPDGMTVVWWFEVTNADGTSERGEAKPTSDHARGVLEAASVILRGNGVPVAADSPEAGCTCGARADACAHGGGVTW